MAQQTEQVELAAVERAVLGKKVKQLRREGVIPGVMYGRSSDTIALQFDARELERVLSQVGGSQLIAIQIEGKKKAEMALVRDVQRDVLKGNVLHVDLYQVDMTEKLTTEIPLLMVGESPVAARNEGVLLFGVSSIEVECLPSDLVDAIEVDLSELVEVDDAIHVSDLAVPAGMEVLTDVQEMIARVTALMEEEVLEEIVPEEELEVEGVELVGEGEEVAEEEAEAEEE